MMYTYSALSELRTEANCSGVKLRRIVSVGGCTGAHFPGTIG